MTIIHHPFLPQRPEEIPGGTIHEWIVVTWRKLTIILLHMSMQEVLSFWAFESILFINFHSCSDWEMTLCKLAVYNIPDSTSLIGLSVLISLSLAYVDYGSLTVTTIPPYNDLIILLVCFCSECFLLPSRQQVSTLLWTHLINLLICKYSTDSTHDLMILVEHWPNIIANIQWLLSVSLNCF